MWYSDMCKNTLRMHQIQSQSSSFLKISGAACPQTPLVGACLRMLSTPSIAFTFPPQT